MMNEDKLDKLVDELTKPIFLLRMSRAQAHRTDSKGAGARKVLENAREQIHAAVVKYNQEDKI